VLDCHRERSDIIESRQVQRNYSRTKVDFAATGEKQLHVVADESSCGDGSEPRCPARHDEDAHAFTFPAEADVCPSLMGGQ